MFNNTIMGTPIDDPAGIWTDEKNGRRFELIDKSIDDEDSFTEADQDELQTLTDEMREYIDRVAPLDIDDARNTFEYMRKKAEEKENTE